MPSERTDLVSLDYARKHLIPRRPDGRPVNPSTVWRWIRRGLQSDKNGKRIRLEVTYVGNRPYVRAIAVEAFFKAVTDAKLQRHRQAEDNAADVTDDALQRAGLV